MDFDSTVEFLGNTLILSGLYYLIYRTFFHKTAHLHFNRFLILGLILLSIVLPMLPKYQWLSAIPTTPMQFPIEWLNGGNDQLSSLIETIPVSSSRLYLFLACIYAVGFGLCGFKLFRDLLQIGYLIYASPSQRAGQFFLITVKENMPVFSFFHFIFHPKTQHLDEHNPTLLHEQAHAQQFHSADRLFIELVRLFFWFNPFYYLFKQRMVENHEYLADKAVIKAGFSTIDYMHLLLHSVQQKNATVKSTFHSFIKKRIMKLSERQEESTPLLLLLLFAIPPLFLALELPNTSFEEWDTTVEMPCMEMPTQDTLRLYPPLTPKYFERLVSGYGIRIHPITRKRALHNGADFMAPKGTLVTAIADGKVLESTFNKKLGNYIVLKHNNGLKSRYHHLSENLVEAGQKVVGNTPIGKVGSTGISTAPHLHFAIQLSNDDYVDPEEYFPIDKRNN